MTFVISQAGSRAKKSAASATIKETLRELNIQLASLNNRIGTRAGIRHADFNCLNAIARFGPIGAGSLARRMGIHLATLTGILDRLEGDGWITRESVASDRRAIRVRVLASQVMQLVRLYRGMNNSIDQICAEYTSDELEVVIRFLRQTVEAGAVAAKQISTKHLVPDRLSTRSVSTVRRRAD
jgi:DNA-binding MarR family transcriptional regulator